MKLDVINTTQSPWYAAGLRFQCTQCGNCCTGGPGYVWITQEEIARLSEYLGMSVEETVRRYCRKIDGRFSLKERQNLQGLYDCIFLKEQKIEGSALLRRGCSIYAARPLQCRTWPFWEGNLASHDNWRRAAHKCPGIDHGRTYSREEIEKMRDAEDWPK